MPMHLTETVKKDGKSNCEQWMLRNTTTGMLFDVIIKGKCTCFVTLKYWGAVCNVHTHPTHVAFAACVWIFLFIFDEAVKMSIKPISLGNK